MVCMVDNIRSVDLVVAWVSHTMTVGGQFQRVHTAVGPLGPSLAKVGRGAPDTGRPQVSAIPPRGAFSQPTIVGTSVPARILWQRGVWGELRIAAMGMGA